MIIQRLISHLLNLPKSLLESIEAFNALNGGVSEQTRLKILPIIDNPNEEIKNGR